MSNRLHIELGGTHIRWEILSPELQIISSGNCKVTDYPSLEEMFLVEIAPQEMENISQLLVATPSLTNEGIIPNSENKFQAKLPASHPLAAEAEYLNDFEALAYTAHDLSSLDLHGLSGDPTILPQGSCKIDFIGPGTGLGTATADCMPYDITVIKSESQHIAAPADNLYELMVLGIMAGLIAGQSSSSAITTWLNIGKKVDNYFNLISCSSPNNLKTKIPYVTLEQIACGDGLSYCYRAIRALDHAKYEHHDAKPEEIIQRVIRDRPDDNAVNAVKLWANYLGVATRNLALSHFENKKPVILVLGGGVIPNFLRSLANEELKENIATPQFQELFAKPFMGGLHKFPSGNESLDSALNNAFDLIHVAIPLCDNPGLMGLRCYARKRMCQMTLFTYHNGSVDHGITGNNMRPGGPS